MSEPTAPYEVITALPEKMRAHVAAKAMGLSSRELLAALAEIGVEIKSAQSTVTRRQLDQWYSAKGLGAEPAETADSATDTADSAVEPGEAEKPGLDEETSSATSDSSTEPSQVTIFTGEVGIAESTGRRRRSTASPSFSPLFLSPEDSAESSPQASAAPSEDDAETSEDGGNSRRRRRGRRGRGRGRGDGVEAAEAQENTNSATESTTESQDKPSKSASDTSTSDTEDQGSTESSSEGGSDSEEESSSRRRRRRRRRGGSSDSGTSEESTSDDPPNTEIHERTSRRSSRSGSGKNEVQGISGSTRLEAKRQRRRDGREAGRRRQPILSEAEFLARRESVDRVMVVREKQRVEGPGVMTQVGVLEDNVLVEHFVTTESARSMVGNVYLGRVQNVLPSMEAAFVDIGRGRNGVLYAGEVNWDAAGLGGRARRIEQALSPGDLILVQVTKDPVGQKGARLTTQISLAGRFLVYVPDGNSTGISRKLPDNERRRLKAILKEVVPEGSGVIIRTAAEGVSEEEIGRDVERLAAQWKEISTAAEKRIAKGSGTAVSLYEEPDLLVKVVRDLFNEDFSKLVIEGEKSWSTVHDYVSRVAPDMEERLERYENPNVDAFATYRVDEQLAKALDRKVWLPSGGSLIIDRTEAMTVIDVNTGKYTGSGGNLEETVTKNNLEAAEEIVRQLRLRDVGGMVIVDFIDMVLESNRDLVLRRLTEALGRDRTRHQVSEVTSLGLVQLTRKKLGTGLIEAFSTPCEHCQGRGIVIHADPVHTESHTSDEPGGRRNRRRGNARGDGVGSSSGDNQPEAKANNKPNNPARGAHPAALAMHRGEEEQPEAEAQEASSGAEEHSASPEEKAPRRRRRVARKAASAADPTVTTTSGEDSQAPESTEVSHEVAALAGQTMPDATMPDQKASLPETPVVVASEPRKRPARRRAQRSSTPTGTAEE